MLVGDTIPWKSVKQATTASSTMHAEFIVCHKATFQVIWLRNFNVGLKVMDSISRSMKVYHNYNASVFYSKNNKVIQLKTYGSQILCCS